MIAQIKKFITTFFCLGYLPLIPGTFGSVVGLFIYILLKKNFHLLILVHCLRLILGFLLSGQAAKLFKRKDPPQIVIDEINGMLISLLALPTEGTGIFNDKLILITGFAIFRVLDAVKPYPADLLQHREGSLGIMGDDIVAGAYTNIILRLVIFLL